MIIVKKSYISRVFKQKYSYICVAILILSLIIVYNYIYKNHRNIADEKPKFKVESKVFGKEFLIDPEKATIKYIDKIIQVSGKVTEIENDNFTLDDIIVCYTDNMTIKKIAKNISLTIKGRSIGYDELLEIIKLDQVIIINY